MNSQHEAELHEAWAYAQRQLAAENASLRSRIAELETALKPFAAEADQWCKNAHPDDFHPACDVSAFDVAGDYVAMASFTVGDLRRARSVLAPPQRQGDRPELPNDLRSRETKTGENP